MNRAIIYFLAGTAVAIVAVSIFFGTPIQQNIMRAVGDDPARIVALDGSTPELAMGQSLTVTIAIEDDHLDYVDRVNGLRKAGQLIATGVDISVRLEDWQREAENRASFRYQITAGDALGPATLKFAFDDGSDVTEETWEVTIVPRPPAVVRFETPEEIVAFVPIELTAQIQHMEPDTATLISYLEVPAGAARIVDTTRTTPEPGILDLRFTVEFSKVGPKVPMTLHVEGETGDLAQAVSVQVSMPVFENPEGSNFIEMTEAPDSSIYGSHITLWRSFGNRLLVTGHAVSHICREISGAVFNYALRVGAINEDFFVGAGLANIDRDPELKRAADNISARLAAYPEVENVVVKRNFFGFRSGFDRDALQILLTAGTSGDALADALSISSEVRTGYEAEALRLESELEDTAPIDDPGLAFVTRQLADIDRALTIAQSLDVDRFRAALAELQRIPTDERAALLADIETLVEFVESDQDMQASFGRLEEDSGLVHVNELNTRLPKEVFAGVKTFAERPETTGALRLGEWDEAGVTLLPFLVQGQDAPLSFRVPQTLFFSGEGDAARKLFRSAVMDEMRDDMLRAAERFEALAAFDEDYLKRVARYLNSQTEAARREFLNTVQDVPIYRKDGTGRKHFVGYRRMTNYKLILEKPSQITIDRNRAAYFRASAARIAGRAKDPKLQQIQDIVLLDSFLRNWDLAFADSSQSSPYSQWIGSHRDAVWAEFQAQGNAIGVDVADIVSENTVFRVDADGSDFVIRPLFVADMERTQAVKTPGTQLVIYRTGWEERGFDYLDRSTAEASGCDEDWDRIMSAQKGGAPVGRFPDLALCLMAPDPATGIVDPDRLSLALSVDPETATNRLLELLWTSWTAPKVPRNDKDLFSEYTPNEAFFPDFDQVEAGDFDFPDEYLRIVNNIDAQLPSLQAEVGKLKLNLAGLNRRVAAGDSSALTTQLALERQISSAERDLSEYQDLRDQFWDFGSKLDLEFMQAGLGQSPAPRSPRWQSYARYAEVAGLHALLDTATCLAAARRSIEEDEATGGIARTELAKCRAQLQELHNAKYDWLLRIDEEVKAQLDALKSLLDDNFNTDNLGRYLIARRIDEISGALVMAGYQTAEARYRSEPGKALLDLRVRLLWSGGLYARALDLAVVEAQRLSSSAPRTVALAQEIESRKEELIKALVYSGGRIDGLVFGRRSSDWVSRPDTVDAIPVRLAAGGSGNGLPPLPPTTAIGYPDLPVPPRGPGQGAQKLSLLSDEMANVQRQASASQARAGYITQEGETDTRPAVWVKSGNDVLVYALPRAEGTDPVEVSLASGQLDRAAVWKAMADNGGELVHFATGKGPEDGVLVLRNGDRVELIDGAAEYGFRLAEGTADLSETLAQAGLDAAVPLEALPEPALIRYVTTDRAGRLSLEGAVPADTPGAIGARLSQDQSVAVPAENIQAWDALAGDSKLRTDGVRVLMTENRRRAARNMHELNSLAPPKAIELVKGDFSDIEWVGSDGVVVLLVRDWNEFRASAEAAGDKLLGKQIALIPSRDAAGFIPDLREFLLDNGARLVSVPHTDLDAATAERIFDQVGARLTTGVAPGRTLNDVLNDAARDVLDMPETDLPAFRGYVFNWLLANEHVVPT